MDAKNIKPIHFISDYIENRENLSFGFSAYADAITGLIASKKNKTPFTIGISGKWGSGKTTLMKAIEDRLKVISKNVLKKEAGNGDFRRIETVWFEAWKYKDEDEILAALLDVILNSMQVAKPTMKGKIIEFFRQINYRKSLSIASKAVSKTTLGMEVDLTELKETDKPKEKPHELLLGFYDVFNKSFNEILWDYLDVEIKKGKEEKDNHGTEPDEQAVLAIFIDDLDRCPPKKIIQVMETVKLFMDRKGCVFVIGAAKSIIEKALKNSADYDTKDAAEFMEKIVQVNFPLPEKDTEDAGEFINEILNSLNLDPLVEKEIDEDLLKLILLAIELNPRRVIALFNDVSLQVGIIDSQPNTEIAFKKLLLWRTIERCNPPFFSAIKNSKKYFDDFKSDVKVFEGFSDDEIKDKKSAELKLSNPNNWAYLEDEFISGLFVAMGLDDDDYNTLVRFTSRFKEETSPEQQAETQKAHFENIQKSKKDAPSDYQSFVKIDGGTYNLEGIGKKEIKSFEIGKYPVTNKWFREFMNDGGYQNEQFWSVEGNKWRKEHKISKTDSLSDEAFNHPGKPVVEVSWYEAEAFSRWWCVKQDVESGIYRLPTEEEWQAAAGGVEARKYPWGEEWNPDLCNNLELGLGGTTVVDLFHEGKTVGTGIFDMSGNIWEWTNSQWAKDEPRRIIRGGSWRTDAEYCRVSGRGSIRPGGRIDNLGFRLAHSL